MRHLSRRIIRKLKSILVQLVPYNISYKPKGTYSTINDYISSSGEKQSKAVTIYPAYMSTLSITKDFYSHCSTYLQSPVIASIPPAVLVEVPNGRLHTDKITSVAVVSHDNRLIGEVSYQMGKQKPEGNIIFKQNYFTRPKRYKGVAFHILIGGSGDNNYFHWLFDALPRIHLLKKSGWFDKVDWFIVPSHKRGFQKDTLRLLGIDESKIVEGHRETHIQADTMLVSTYVRYYGHIPEWACKFLRESFLQIKTPEVNTYSYIYISRNDSNIRYVMNEPALLSVLDEYGFKKVELGALSFAEQVSLFASAKVIVAPHGAGLANLVFCKKGTSVIELFAEDYVIPLYYDLANKVELNYNYLICESDAKANNVKQGMRLNILVDLKKIKVTLSSTLELHSAKSMDF